MKAKQTEEAPIIEYLQRLLTEAVRERASDIHFEPLETCFRIRFRIDGVLQKIESPSKHLQSSIISRLKLMGDMSIAEKRIAQDGHAQMQIGSRNLNLRLSSIPTIHGESVVLRLLESEQAQRNLSDLGLLSHDQTALQNIMQQADGMVLLTGPTGSGKTTTLYSILQQINKPERKIITIEDPIEYHIPGVTQVPVRADLGLSFATALRSILRQAPNVIMIGEIRDRETAEIAINASLTGHTVYSTLHTNDAASAITRLSDIGIPPYLLSATLRGVIAQRLIRRVCPDCVEIYTPSQDELEVLNIQQKNPTAHNSLRYGKGCPTCRHTGYHGRIGVFEILQVDDKLRQLIYTNCSHSKLKKTAIQNGMRTLQEDGYQKALNGLTSLHCIRSLCGLSSINNSACKRSM